MGTLFQFDKMLPTIELEAKSSKNPQRQVEVFTYDRKLWLRVGPVNSENTGENRYTVQLSKEHASELVSAIEDGVRFLSV